MKSIILIFCLCFIATIVTGKHSLLSNDNRRSNPHVNLHTNSRAVSTTPVCIAPGSSITADVGVVLYPAGPSTNCQASAHLLKPYSIWYGYKYGVCTQNNLCGNDCAGIEACGSKGYTIDQFNNCYNGTYGICPIPTDYIIIDPINQYTLKGRLFADKACTVPKPDSNNNTVVTFTLDTCSNINFPCGYNTTTWIRINKCPEPTPDVSGASGLGSFWFF